MSDDAALFAHAARLAAEGHRFSLVTVIETRGSTPRKAGAKMIVTREGEIFGTIGGGRVELEIAEEARAAAQDGRARTVKKHLTRDLAMCCGGEMTLLLDPSGRRETLLIAGAGHIAAALSPIGVQLGFEVVVCDDMEEMATRARFPLPVRILSSFSPKDWQVALDHDTYLVIATRDHAVDQEILEALWKLEATPAYLGVIGSKAKLARFRKRLEARGVGGDFITSIRGPIGVDVGAETPAEIAVSVAAELVETRRRPSVPQTREAVSEDREVSPA